MLLVGIAVVSVTLLAQTPASPAFEVVSIRQNRSDSPQGTLMIQPGGRFVASNTTVIGIVNIAYQQNFKAEVNFAPVLTKRLTLAATTLRARTADQKQAIRDVLRREVWPLVGAQIRPVTDRVFALEQAQQAHEYMAKTGHIGKILLKMA